MGVDTDALGARCFSTRLFVPLAATVVWKSRRSHGVLPGSLVIWTGTSALPSQSDHPVVDVPAGRGTPDVTGSLVRATPTGSRIVSGTSLPVGAWAWVVNVQHAPNALSFGEVAASRALLRQAYVVLGLSAAGAHVLETE
jgi:hypothetical protein